MFFRVSRSEGLSFPSACFQEVLSTFPGSADVKNPAANIGDVGSIPGSRRSSGGGNGNPLQVLLPGKFHGQRSLVGYSPWDGKESDTPERLYTQVPSTPKCKTLLCQNSPKRKLTKVQIHFV